MVRVRVFMSAAKKVLESKRLSSELTLRTHTLLVCLYHAREHSMSIMRSL